MNTSSEWSSGEGYHLVGGARHFSDGTHKVRVVHAAYTAHIHALLFSPLEFCSSFCSSVTFHPASPSRNRVSRHAYLPVLSHTQVRPGTGVGGTSRSGSVPVLMDTLLGQSSVPWMEVPISNASLSLYPTSSWTACVHEVCAHTSYERLSSQM
jgi:hypothetical protein